MDAAVLEINFGGVQAVLEKNAIFIVILKQIEAVLE